VINLPVAEVKPIPGPVVLSPAIVTPTQTDFSTTTNLSPTNALTVSLPAIKPALSTAPILPSSTLVLAQPITTSGGTTMSLTDIAKDLQNSSTLTSKSTSPLLDKNVTIQVPTQTTGQTGLSPKTFTLRR
jgi:hypothetical protein